jgi:enoyl-CoA hydratase/carnithine racemase
MADDASLADITGLAMEPTMPAILCESSGHLAHVTLNRAEHGNRISMEMFRTLGEEFTALDANPAIRCILLTANGADFSLGVDVPDVLPSWALGKSPFEAHHVNPFGTTGPKCRKPLVMVVQGQCFNAGLELALAADIVIAADNARFAFHEIHFGVYPYGGGLFRMIRAAGWNAAMRYALTGAEFSATDALRMNVVAQTCPLAEAKVAGVALATAISNKSATRRPGSARAGADLGRPRRRRGAEPFGARHRSPPELARRQRSDAGGRGGPSARLFRRVTKGPSS